MTFEMFPLLYSIFVLYSALCMYFILSLCESVYLFYSIIFRQAKIEKLCLE